MMRVTTSIRLQFERAIRPFDDIRYDRRQALPKCKQTGQRR